MKYRAFEMSLADMQHDEDAFRELNLITADIQGKKIASLA